MFRLLVLATACFASLAHAQQSGFLTSEYFHQAEAGVFEITPGIGQGPGKASFMGNPTLQGVPMGYSYSTTSFRGTSIKSNASVVPILVDLEYGLTPMFSIGGLLGYGTADLSFSNCPTGTTCTGSKAKGFFDPNIYIQGRSALPTGQLQYGLNLQLGLEKSWTDGNSNESNFAEGGHTLTPFLGYQMQAGLGVWGVRALYGLRMERETDVRDTNTKDKYRGGNFFGLETFYETPISGDTTVGAALNYTKRSTSESKSGTGDYTDDKNASSSIKLKLYAPMPMGSFTLLPAFSYLNESYDNSNSGEKSRQGYELALAARFSL